MRILLLFCCLPCFASAQSWNTIVKTGALWNSRSSQPIINEHSSPINMLIAVGVSRHQREWEAGMSIGMYRYAFRIEGDFALGPDPATGAPVIEHLRFVDPIPAMAFKPFLNRYLDTGRLSCYVGLAPSYLLFFNHEPYDPARKTARRTNNNGFGMELHGGCQYRISEGASFFAEPALGYVNLPGFTRRAHMLSASLALGFRLTMR